MFDKTFDLQGFNEVDGGDLRIKANHSPIVSDPIEVIRNESDANVTVDLLQGASDADADDSLSVRNMRLLGGDHQGITFNSDHLIVYPRAYGHLGEGESEVVRISYNVIDSNGGSVGQTATITIVGENDAPTVADPIVVNRNEADANVTVDLLDGARDADAADTLSVRGMQLLGGDHQGITFRSDHLIVYPRAYGHLNDGESEVIRIGYNVIDGNGGSVAQTATITIEGRDTIPKITAPVDSGEDRTPTIRWTRAADDKSYEVLVYSVDRGTEEVNRKGLKGNRFKIGPLNPNETYQVFVRARQHDGTMTAYSAPWNFTIAGDGEVDLSQAAAPVFSTPSGETNDSQPTIKWSAVAGATGYDLLMYDADAGKQLANESVNGTSWKPTTALGSSKYVAYVRATNSAGTGNWSALNFEVSGSLPSVPELVGPSGAIGDTTPTVTWNTSAGAASYRVLIYSINRGAEVVNASGVNGTSYTTPTLLAGEKYQVFVQAELVGGGTSGFSRAMSFSITGQPLVAPTFINPNQATSDTTPSFRWESVAGAESYELLAYNVEAGRQVAHVRSANTFWTSPSPLEVASHQLFVRSLSADGSASGWTMLEFDIELPKTVNAVLGTVFSGLVDTGI